MNDVSYYTYEGTCARLERINKRQFILIILLILLLIFSNGLWLYYESQWEDVTTTITQEAENENGSVVLNGTGEVNYYGESETNSNS